MLIPSTALPWLEFVFFHPGYSTVTIRSSIVIVDAEEYDRAGVTEFNDFGVAVIFGVVVADLCVVEGDDDLLKTVFLVKRLVLNIYIFFYAVFCHGLYVVAHFW